mmetsp:Transcript_19749/g.62168  ORF Transcript_19749/g.62168 Transcript_19749/m.62168 type:complete len:175 (-) Transcript_19749:301-825(-)
MRTDGLYLVYQMTVGGGNYKKHGESGLTAFPWRGSVIGIIFDVFYRDENYAALAEEKQTKMKNLLPIMTGERSPTRNSPGSDIRQTWGSFGNIEMKEMWQHYYEETTWRRLQRLKQQVDPNDIFTTPFTVQLPEDSPEDNARVETAARKTRKRASGRADSLDGPTAKSRRSSAA